jgi:hypothetical protein
MSGDEGGDESYRFHVPDIDFQALNEATRQALTLDVVALNEATRQALLDMQALDKATRQALTLDFQALNEAAQVALQAPSIEADLQSLSTATRTRSQTRYTQPIEQSPEERIHDTVIWDDGKWYRDQLWAASSLIANYIFFSAYTAGELTDLSDEEIAVCLGTLTFFIMSVLAGPIAGVKVGLGVGAFTPTLLESGRKRAEREISDERDP